MARPAKSVDLQKLKALMRMKPTLADTAAFFECSERTIERVIDKEFGVSFVEFRQQNMVHTRLNLTRKAIQMAEAGNVPMLIFSLKNLADWADKRQGEAEVVINNFTNASDEDVDRRLAELLKKAEAK